MTGPEGKIFSLPAEGQAALWVCFLLLLALAFAPAVKSFRGLRAKWFVPIWLLPYLIYAAGCHDFRWAAVVRLLAICGPPLLAYCVFPVRNSALLNWQDAFAWLWMAVAILLRQFAGVWNVPANLDFMSRLFMIAVASWIWVFVRRVPELGYGFSISLRTLRAAGINFLLFALIAIPAGLAMGFTAWNPRWPGLGNFLLGYIEIFVFIAWLEELFFRGFLQTLLSRTLKAPWRGQLLTSCIFGLSHILNAPAPNWRYVALASVAGWFYGAAFRQGSNLMASSIPHALVDAVWRAWFHRA